MSRHSRGGGGGGGGGVREWMGCMVIKFYIPRFFTASLINLARETRIALHEYDHFSSS